MVRVRPIQQQQEAMFQRDEAMHFKVRHKQIPFGINVSYVALQHSYTLCFPYNAYMYIKILSQPLVPPLTLFNEDK